jgi:hypothetical protein
MKHGPPPPGGEGGLGRRPGGGRPVTLDRWYQGTAILQHSILHAPTSLGPSGRVGPPRQGEESASRPLLGDRFGMHVVAVERQVPLGLRR